MAEVRPSSRRGNRRPSYGPNPVVASEIDSMQMDSMGGHYNTEGGTGKPESRPGTSQSIDMQLGNTPSVSPETNRRRRMRPKSAKGRTRSSAGYQTHSLSQQMSLQDDDVDTESAIEQVLRTTPVRPNSSLSKFRPLPAIQKSASMDCNTHDDNMNISHYDNSTSPSSHYYEEPSSVNKHQTFPQRTTDLPDNDNHSAPQHAYTAPIAPHNHDPPPQLNSNVNKSSHKISRKDFRQHQKARLARVKLNIPVPSEPGKDEHRIQLAIRLPEGERLIRFFHPTNLLKEVLAYADSESSESLLDCDMFINSVPEKIFMDLSKSIKDCGLQDKTVIYLEGKDYE